ncbi:hypothetical protein AWH56_008585 [Anaerobacillus isosaccharinicus]|uniref:Lipoprotein n=1 Tax=Anaerobacillus isosaccharinicus TaxID=1532552 RepID=A0A1S2L0Y2_9BACI|nr:hypothetical protein [Anaerobacillus isosaccharinicus]MBA5583959.1 hypothetical protein [Anaerobacillus isosaccharinicus]QOY37621.1 hypothetical protein AWH56_008585 [Anaerobacillus isosaccharinicus]
MKKTKQLLILVLVPLLLVGCELGGLFKKDYWKAEQVAQVVINEDGTWGREDEVEQVQEEKQSEENIEQDVLLSVVERYINGIVNEDINLWLTSVSNKHIEEVVKEYKENRIDGDIGGDLEEAALNNEIVKLHMKKLKQKYFLDQVIIMKDQVSMTQQEKEITLIFKRSFIDSYYEKFVFLINIVNNEWLIDKFEYVLEKK